MSQPFIQPPPPSKGVAQGFPFLIPLLQFLTVVLVLGSTVLLTLQGHLSSDAATGILGAGLGYAGGRSAPRQPWGNDGGRAQADRPNA